MMGAMSTPRSTPQMPLPRRPTIRASSDIIHALRTDIASGRLPLGARLPTETDLAAHYGVSKPTIREAIRSLDTLGMVEVRHGSGTYVRADSTFLVMTALQTAMQIERTTILDALAVREVLGVQSARWAAVRRSDDELAGLEETYAALAAMTYATLEELMDGIARFQEQIVRMTHNPLMITIESVLIRTLLEMQFKALRQRGFSFWRARAAAFQPDRRALIDAVAASDVAAAEAAVAAYAAHQREVFVSDPALVQLSFSDPAALKAAQELSTATRLRDS